MEVAPDDQAVDPELAHQDVSDEAVRLEVADLVQVEDPHGVHTGSFQQLGPLLDGRDESGMSSRGEDLGGMGVEGEDGRRVAG